MEGLIKIMQDLQKIFFAIENKEDCIELPSIVVVGSQSTGKSSVLESLVGKSFLPRGTGIVTRRPLIIQLINSSHSTDITCKETCDAWAMFGHNPNKIYTRFDEVRKEILDETNRVAGYQCNVSEIPILLKIYSKDSFTLTLVDLPGLTKVPVGEQPEDIEQQIRHIVFNYITPAHNIILPIITANTDVATSESLQIARLFDPKGNRTVAVLTKLDLMDAGTNAYDILSGRIIHVPLGIIGLVNRSQRDTQESKTIADAITDEKTFFQKYYPKIANRNGTAYLSKTLQTVLIQHIRKFIPSIKMNVLAKIRHCQSILTSFGEPVNEKREQVILKIITDFCTNFRSAVNGNCKNIETSELTGGARIVYIFEESFGNSLSSLNPLAGLKRESILTAMRNACGTHSLLFIPEVTFELLVKRQIKQLEEPSLRCAELVYEELEMIIHKCVQNCDERNRFPNLFNVMADLCSELLKSQLPKCKYFIKQLINIQLAHINTNHPDFVKDAAELTAWSPCDRSDCTSQSVHVSESRESDLNVNGTQTKTVIQRSKNTSAANTTPLRRCFLQGSTLTGGMGDHVIADHSSPARNFITENNNNKTDCVVIEYLIKSYFQIVNKSIKDSVPKAIMHSIVNYILENIEQMLVSKLYHYEQLENLIKESDIVTKKRQEKSNKLKALEKALDTLNAIRDSDILSP